PPVVVEVTDSAAHPITSAGDPGTLRDVLEGTVTSVAIKFVRLWRGSPIEGQRTTIDKIDVEPTVVIEVEQSNAPAHRVSDEEIASCTAVVSKGDSGPIGDVLKPGTGIRPGREPRGALERLRHCRPLEHGPRQGHGCLIGHLGELRQLGCQSTAPRVL